MVYGRRTYGNDAKIKAWLALTFGMMLLFDLESSFLFRASSFCCLFLSVEHIFEVEIVDVPMWVGLRGGEVEDIQAEKTE